MIVHHFKLINSISRYVYFIYLLVCVVLLLLLWVWLLGYRIPFKPVLLNWKFLVPGWSLFLFLCAASSCGPPQIPANSEFWRYQRGKTTYVYSDIVLFRCKLGYFSKGIGLRICGFNGWSGPSFICSRKFPISLCRVIVLEWIKYCTSEINVKST